MAEKGCPAPTGIGSGAGRDLRGSSPNDSSALVAAKEVVVRVRGRKRHNRLARWLLKARADCVIIEGDEPPAFVIRREV